MKAKELFSLLLVVPFLISVGCGGGTGTDSGSSSTNSGGTTGELLSISVTPGNPSVPVDIADQFIAFGTYSDGTTKDITTQVTWTSSDPSVATVDGSGLGTAVAAGAATITATSRRISGSTTFRVNHATLSSISITPANPSVPVGNRKQFTASGAYSDGTTQNITTRVTWRSSNATVATVNSRGLATAVAAGTATITSTLRSISGNTTFTVNPSALSSIAITPANPTIAVGNSKQFAASGIYSDGTTADVSTQVTWGSSNTAVATVTSSGLAAAVTAGSSNISASSGTVSGNTTLTATPATLSSISITPANPSIPDGTTKQFSASGRYSDGTSNDITAQVTWRSSNTAVATVNSSGLATAVTGGNATITATSGSVSGNTTLAVTLATLSSISITPANPTTPAGNTQQFTASGTYSDGTTNGITTQVTWRSANTAVATVDSNGLATAVSPGTATIAGTSGSISGNTILTVAPASAGTIRLACDPPTTNTDGTPLTDLAGYKIFYGTASGAYDHSIDVGNIATYTLTGLTPGQTYYISATAYDTSKMESGYSNEVSGMPK